MVEKKESKTTSKKAAGEAVEKEEVKKGEVIEQETTMEATEVAEEAVADASNGASDADASDATEKKKDDGQKKTVVIAVLVTVLVCVAAFFGIGVATGMIKLGGETNTNEANTTDTNTTATATPEATATPKATSDTGDGRLINNPNKQVKADGTLVRAGALQFYLPKAFTLGSKSGGESEGSLAYNLTDGDGWADVRVYFEKSNKDARDYLLAKNSNLSVSSDALIVSGWSWSTANAANGGIRAWATNYGDYVYAVILTVKLDSDETNEAARMIPKTLYFEKIYK